MKAFLILFLATAVLAQENIQSIVCPVPGNPPPEAVTEVECSALAACEFTDGICHMKKNDVAGYVVSSDPVDTGNGFTVTLDKADASATLFGADIPQLTLEVINHEDYHVQVKIYDAANARYEVPFPLNTPDEVGTNPLYSVGVSAVGSPFVLNVTRNSNGNRIFKTIGPLTFEDQFLQISTQLFSSYFYGIGETPANTLRRPFDIRRTYPIFARDQPVPSNAIVNEYGTHPYYVNVEDDDGNTHSVLLYSSNAMEFSTFPLADSSPAVTMRTIGGIIDLHFFLGPTPEDVNIQYATAVGKAEFAPYWSLGFQLSRWGYDTSENYMVVHDRMKAAGIPWDVQVFDIDYMYRYRDFTYDPDRFGDLPSVIDHIHEDTMKVVLILDPAVVIDFDNYPPGQRGKDADAFIKWGSSDLVPSDQPAEAGEYVVGYVWPDNKTVFPDFFKPEARAWWADEILRLKAELDFDGLWIDMNEPANFGTNMNRPFNYPQGEPDWSLKCPTNNLEDPPYPTLAATSSFSNSGRLSDKTICMSAIQTDGTNIYTHYDVHNLYGFTETIATHDALEVEGLFPLDRNVILSRSTFPGSGKYAVHWLGDNDATFEQLRTSLIGMMEFNMFAMPMVGADVCGFFNEPSEELCIRWMQAGAFYPFDRNHNTNGTADQDPTRPGWDLAPVISRDVLLLRYKYLPFFYARFHRTHMNGRSLIRPLFNVFPTDLTARNIDSQFFWSEEMMVAPVFEEGAVSRDVYFPLGNYYDLETGVLVARGPVTQTVDAPLEKIPVFARGGFILPFQEPDVTTVLSRQNPFGLTVALDDSLSAIGEIFWDDGIEEHVMSETYIGDLAFSNNELTLGVRYDPTVADGLILETIQFFGYPSNPTSITVNDVAADASSWSYDDTTSVLTFTLSVPINEDFSIVLA